MFRKPEWPTHVWVAIVIAILSLGSSLWGNYLQWLQLRSPTGRAVSAVSKAQPQPYETAVSKAPFLLSSTGSGLLFVVLLLMARRYARSVADHKDVVFRYTQTLQDRDAQMSGLQDQIKKILSSHQQLDTIVAALSNVQAERLENLETFRAEAIKERTAIEARFTAVENRTHGAMMRLDEHRPWISELEEKQNVWASAVQGFNDGVQNRVKTLEAQVQFASKALESIPTFTVELEDYAELVRQIDMIAAVFEYIRQIYPASAVANWPFSRAWDAAQDDGDEPIKLGSHWQICLEGHYRYAAAFCRRIGINVSAICTGELSECIKQWRTTGSERVSGEAVGMLLGNHRNNLQALREGYADKFRIKAHAIATAA